MVFILGFLIGVIFGVLMEFLWIRHVDKRKLVGDLYVTNSTPAECYAEFHKPVEQFKDNVEIRLAIRKISPRK